MASLRSIERKAYFSFHSDGLWELALGLIIFAGVFRGLLPDLGVSIPVAQIMSIAVALSGALIVGIGKKRITIPRLGFVQFGHDRKKRQRWLYGIIFLLIVITWMIWMLAASGAEDSVAEFNSTNLIMSGVVTLLILFAFGAMAFLLDYRRFYFYAFLVAIREPLFVYLKYYTSWKGVYFITDGIPALILLIIGAITLMAFLRKYPKRGRGAEYEQDD